MTPGCCNCTYFRDKTRTCRNPDSTFYLEEMRYVDKCQSWEHWREFIDEEKRRLRHGKKR